MENEDEDDCGDVRSRTSYNPLTILYVWSYFIVVTSDLGRVTTLIKHSAFKVWDCGDVRSRTSYN